VILAGDVGGTKCNLALFTENRGNLQVVYRQRFPSKGFAKFDLLVKEFAREAEPYLRREKVRAAGFGVAGPVINNRIHATNLPWVVDAEHLAQELNVKPIVLLNDLGATGRCWLSCAYSPGSTLLRAVELASETTPNTIWTLCAVAWTP